MRCVFFLEEIKMERSNLNVSLHARRMKNEKNYREKILVMIVANVCALLNTCGGELRLNFEDNSGIEEEASDILRSIEQRLINIIGLCIFNTNVKVPELQKSRIAKQLVITIQRMASLCTVNYHLYLPTQKQVMAIPPSSTLETVKGTLNRKVPKEQNPQILRFVRDRQVSLTESESIQFKQLKDKKSKCVSLADRITNDSNKLSRNISAFANKGGGRIYYGIRDNGTVKGEVMTEKHQDEIIRKVTTTIDKMIWSADELKLERSKHWNIKFEPVKDTNMNTIPSLFVAIISVEPLPGGVFTKQPDSYHVNVEGRAERMSFSAWNSRFWFGTKQIVPSSVCRPKWSSVRMQRITHKVLEELVKYQNDADFKAFKKCVALAKQNSDCDTDIKLIILGERIVGAYKRGQFMKADSRLEKFKKILENSDTKDHNVFKFRAVYAESAIARAKGDYQESYEIAKRGLQLAEMIPAGILTAWFYNQVAIVEKLLSQQEKDEDKSAALVQSALNHYTKALQHTQASTVEQEFATTIADLQQRIHTFRAITLLGNFASGANFPKATPSDIKAAETSLINYHSQVIQGYQPTNYRKVYYHFSLCDLRMCQWWQKLQQQPAQEGRSSEDYKTPKLLKEAFEHAKEAKELSRKYKFEELFNNANKRLAGTTEMMIKLNYVSCSHVRTQRKRLE